MKNVAYASVSKSLMYSQICVRPDIAYVVNMLGRISSNPSHDHWVIAKQKIICWFIEESILIWVI